jgi:hypothetical protein
VSISAHNGASLVPLEILALKDTRGNLGATDCKLIVIQSTLTEFSENRLRLAINYAEYDLEPAGKVSLIGRIKCVLIVPFSLFFCLLFSTRSHPDVAERHYPELFKQFFPDGLPAQGSVY